MFKTYLASGLLGLGLYGGAQVLGWSVMPTAAEEFQRRRAEETASIHSRTSSGGGRSGGGGFSGK